MSLTIWMARFADASSDAKMFTRAVVVDIDLHAGLLDDARIILPPGPISSRILSVGMVIV